MLRIFCVVLLITLAPSAWARGSGHSGAGHSQASRSSGGAGHQASHASRKAAGVGRDTHGRIKRDPQAKRAFERTHPCPSTGKRSGSCPGYVVDHIQPLKRGGADTPANMQWQTTRDAKLKDRVE